MKRTTIDGLLNINIPGVVCQYSLWYNNVYNIDDVNGVVMLYFSLIDILFLLIGVGIGVVIMACVCSSGYEHKCDDCIFREIVERLGEENE